jgi:CO/xanthine dehydrogenase Mo-binding subunit
VADRTSQVDEGRRVAPSDFPLDREVRRQNTAPPGHTIGTRARKVEGAIKATGQLQYTDDISLPRMLHGKILRSPHAHARILSVDASRALALPGVHDVIFGRDLPTPYGIIPWTRDETALAVDKVLFVGDAVAAVAAADEDSANQALKCIDVAYEVLEPLLYPDVDSPVVVNPFAKEGNVTKHVSLCFGDVEGALAATPMRPSSRTVPSAGGSPGLVN